jgi:transcriptional regulator with XRE-family HTH domain
MMDLEKLSSQLVRALRGRRSQPALSRRLGYRSNVVYAWEKGRRAPTAGDFLRLVARTQSDAQPRIEAFLGQSLPASWARAGAAEVAALLGMLSQGRSVVELAKATHSDRGTVTRWLRGETQPKLPELFAFVQATSQRLLEFVSLFVDPEQVACTRAAYRDLLIQRRLAYELPWSHALLRAFELKQVRALPKHVPGMAGRQVGLSPEEEARYLAALEQGKQVRRVGGRVHVQRVLTVDTRPSEAQNRKLKQHWAEVALARYARGETSPDTLFSYNLFAISQDDYVRVRKLHLEYYERVREIVSESRDPERVVLLNLQLVPLDGAPKREA